MKKARLSSLFLCYINNPRVRKGGVVCQYILHIITQ